MNKKGQIAVGALLLFFIGAIVVLAMLPSIASPIQEITNKLAVKAEAGSMATVRNPGEQNINESVILEVTHVYESTDWRYNDADCNFGSIVIGNGSVNFTDNTHYVFTEGIGNYSYLNTTVTRNSGNTTVIYYTTCQAGYATESGTRGVAGLILILAAVGLLGFAAYFITKGFDMK